jgi:hypothetical protein
MIDRLVAELLTGRLQIERRPPPHALPLCTYCDHPDAEHGPHERTCPGGDCRCQRACTHVECGCERFRHAPL